MGSVFLPLLIQQSSSYICIIKGAELI